MGPMRDGRVGAAIVKAIQSDKASRRPASATGLVEAGPCVRQQELLSL